VCFGDLQSCAQGVAANPEGQGESREGEDEAGHWLSVVDVCSIEAGGGGGGAPCATSQIGHHLVHLHVADLVVVPRYAVRGLPEHPPDLSLHHATLELLPGGLVVTAEGHARLGGVVEELVVLNPEGSVPGLVVCPTVVGRHGLSRLVWLMESVYRVTVWWDCRQCQFTHCPKLAGECHAAARMARRETSVKR